MDDKKIAYAGRVLADALIKNAKERTPDTLKAQLQAMTEICRARNDELKAEAEAEALRLAAETQDENT